MRFSISLFVGALVATVAASNVADLTPDNFDKVVGQGVPALVELCVLEFWLKCIVHSLTLFDFLVALHPGGKLAVFAGWSWAGDDAQCDPL